MPTLTTQTIDDPRPIIPREDFTSLEWLVIAIGARDESVPLQWSPIGRTLLDLFGGGPRPLASPCLEALRRTASVAKHYGWSTPTSELSAFFRSGWSEAQFELLLESVAPEDPFTDEWRPCAAVGGISAVINRSVPEKTTETYT